MASDKYRNELGFVMCPKCKKDSWFLLCNKLKDGVIAVALCTECTYYFKIYTDDVLETPDENSI